VEVREASREDNRTRVECKIQETKELLLSRVLSSVLSKEVLKINLKEINRDSLEEPNRRVRIIRMVMMLDKETHKCLSKIKDSRINRMVMVDSNRTNSSNKEVSKEICLQCLVLDRWEISLSLVRVLILVVKEVSKVKHQTDLKDKDRVIHKVKVMAMVLLVLKQEIKTDKDKVMELIRMAIMMERIWLRMLLIRHNSKVKVDRVSKEISRARMETNKDSKAKVTVRVKNKAKVRDKVVVKEMDNHKRCKISIMDISRPYKIWLILRTDKVKAVKVRDYLIS
jgi:hypothetical protein